MLLDSDGSSLGFHQQNENSSSDRNYGKTSRSLDAGSEDKMQGWMKWLGSGGDGVEVGCMKEFAMDSDS